MSLFTAPPDDARYLSRLDERELLGTTSDHGFQLEDRYWPSVEHYVQAMQFEDDLKQEAIRQAATPQEARRLGKTGWFRRPRRDWSRLRQTYMTRGVYTKCRAHEEVAAALLATGDTRLVENDQYDYYWGCGRDRRGDNTYGKVLMQVRDKLNEEAKNEETAQ